MKDTIRSDAGYQSPDGGCDLGGCGDVADGSATPTKEDTLVEVNILCFQESVSTSIRLSVQFPITPSIQSKAISLFKIAMKDPYLMCLPL